MLDINKRNGSMPDLNSIAVAVVAGKEVSLQEALYTLKLKGQLAGIAAQAVTDRLIAAAAEREGITVSVEEVQQAADRFRMGRGLNRAGATERWLRGNQLSRQDLPPHECGNVQSNATNRLSTVLARPSRIDLKSVLTRLKAF